MSSTKIASQLDFKGYPYKLESIAQQLTIIPGTMVYDGV